MYKRSSFLHLLFVATNKFYLRTTAMETAVSQHSRHLGFFENVILNIFEANFLEISRKHVFTSSNRIIIKSSVGKKKLEQNL